MDGRAYAQKRIEPSRNNRSNTTDRDDREVKRRRKAEDSPGSFACW